MVAPLACSHAASGTPALRLDSITTVTAVPSGSLAHSRSRSPGVVRKRLASHSKGDVGELAWWSARRVTSMPS